MVTTNSPSPSPEPEAASVPAVESGKAEDPGFVGLLAKSIFEPGANAAVVISMNVSFFLLMITLSGLGFLTNWDRNVVILMVTSAMLWAGMFWFVMQITKVQTNPENMPHGDLTIPSADATDDKSGATVAGATPETRKDR